MNEQPQKPIDPDEDKKIKRFPRLLMGKAVSDLEMLLWVPPRFEVRFEKTDKGASTKLIFTIPVPDEFAESSPDFNGVIFERGANQWGKAIEDGYSTSMYNNKPLPQFLSGVLRRVFKKGIRNFLEQNWDLAEEFYKDHVATELTEFDKHTNSMTGAGTRPTVKVAMWAAKRFDQLAPAVKALRSRFKRNIPTDQSKELKAEIEKLCSDETYCAALGNLFPEGKITPWTIHSKDIHPRAIALAIIESELPKHGFELDPKQGALWKHIQLGHNLFRLLASEPNQSSIV